MSALGISMNLDFHPKCLLDKSNLPAGGQNLQQIFNDGDVSMMDEMNRLVVGLNSKGQRTSVTSTGNNNLATRSPIAVTPLSQRGTGA